MNIKDLKLGIYEKALPGGLDWAGYLELAGRLGFSFVEMSIDESDQRLERLKWDRSKRREFRNILGDSELGVPSICLSGHRRFPLGSHDLSIRTRAREILSDAILFAVDTGIRTIQLAGYDVYYEEADSDTWNWFREGLTGGLELAAREHVMLAMETMDTPLMSSIVRFLNLKKELNNPWFTVYPDIGNLSAWGRDLVQELELGMDQIVAIHLKDTQPVTENSPGQFRAVVFGEGCVDFPAAFRTLHQLNYSGPFLIEMWTEKSGHPEKDVEIAREWIIQKMREGGYL